MCQVGDNPTSVFAADLDDDGDLELIAANRGNDSVAVLINKDDGTFWDAHRHRVGKDPLSVFGGDLDGDGDLDLVTADMGSDSITVFLNSNTLPFLCGSIDSLPTLPEPDVVDLTFLVAYVILGGPPPAGVPEPLNWAAANVDGIVGLGGPVDIADLTYLVANLFLSGERPHCGYDIVY